MEMRKVAMSIMAHPDDCEFLCAGTLALLKEKGWNIHIATLTPGDKGSVQHTREEISRIRRQEATRAAALLEGTYHCLEFDDVYIMYDRTTINKTTELLRQVRPGIVFTSSPSDYMVDHEITSKIVQTACFSCGIKNMEVPATPFEPTPYLYYTDPMDGMDILGNRIQPKMWVDIGSTIGLKEEMLCCHASQREWLLRHHGMDEYVMTMKRFAEKRGREAKATFAEGFRQHLGHGFSRDNILKSVLGEFVIER